MISGASETPRARILVVDDSDDSREVCAEILSFWGFEVATAADGYEAIAKALQLRPDVILMDLSMPGLDGWEAARRLRADTAMRSIPLIALTAHSHPQLVLEARQAGFDLVLTKPYPPRELKAIIESMLARPRTGAAPEGGPGSTS